MPGHHSGNRNPAIKSNYMIIGILGVAVKIWFCVVVLLSKNLLRVKSGHLGHFGTLFWWQLGGAAKASCQRSAKATSMPELAQNNQLKSSFKY